jgi:hypothetical protein
MGAAVMTASPLTSPSSVSSRTWSWSCSTERTARTRPGQPVIRHHHPHCATARGQACASQGAARSRSSCSGARNVAIMS